MTCVFSLTLSSISHRPPNLLSSVVDISLKTAKQHPVRIIFRPISILTFVSDIFTLKSKWSCLFARRNEDVIKCNLKLLREENSAFSFAVSFPWDPVEALAAAFNQVSRLSRLQYLFKFKSFDFDLFNHRYFYWWNINSENTLMVAWNWHWGGVVARGGRQCLLLSLCLWKGQR